VDPIVDRLGQPRKHAIVAVDDPAKAALLQIVAGTAALGQRRCADQSQIGAVESCDVPPRESALGRQSPAAWARREKVLKAAIGAAAVVETLHHPLETLPEIVERLQPLSTSVETATANVDASE
jgi:hypothetical protein